MEIKNRKLLVLDLDETLVHSSEAKLDRTPDLVADQYFVYERPFVRDLLEFGFENFEVGIWTTATEGYARHILNSLVGGLDRFRFIWTRDRCTWVFDEASNERIQVKKLEKLKRQGYKPESVIAVDDTRSAWRFSYGNLIHVSRFEGDPEDRELKLLIEFLELIRESPNIRSIEKRNWRSRIK